MRKLREPEETNDCEQWRGEEVAPCCWEAHAAKQNDWIARLKTFLVEGDIEGAGAYPAYNGATVYAPDVRELSWAGFVWSGKFDTVGTKKIQALVFPAPQSLSSFQCAPTARSS